MCVMESMLAVSKNLLLFVKSSHYPAMTPRPDIGSNHHPDCIYLQLLEAHQEISSIFLIKHADHASAELMILHPLRNPRQWHRSEMLYALV